eukprot:26783_1
MRCGAGLYILIVSLLFAAYSGVIFIIQNDQRLNQYSIPIQVVCRHSDICTVNDHFVIDVPYYVDPTDPNDAEFEYDAVKLHENFYNGTFVPYLEKLNDHNLTECFKVTPTLFIWTKTQSSSEFENTGTPNHYNGYLYLNDNDLSHSDFTFSQWCRCCECHKSGCWCIRKGEACCSGCCNCHQCYCGDGASGCTCVCCDCCTFWMAMLIFYAICFCFLFYFDFWYFFY